MLGKKIRELREASGFAQRQLAAELDVDTAYISKMENSNKPINRNHLKKLAKLFKVKEEDLLSIWLADKICQVLENEALAEKALQIAAEQLKTK